MKTFTKSDIELSNGTQFSIIHNLEQFGLNIEDALINWLVRTEEYTDESFCQYINSKGVADAYTQKQFDHATQTNSKS